MRKVSFMLIVKVQEIFLNQKLQNKMLQATVAFSPTLSGNSNIRFGTRKRELQNNANGIQTRVFFTALAGILVPFLIICTIVYCICMKRQERTNANKINAEKADDNNELTDPTINRIITIPKENEVNIDFNPTDVRVPGSIPYEIPDNISVMTESDLFSKAPSHSTESVARHTRIDVDSDMISVSPSIAAVPMVVGTVVEYERSEF